MRVKPKRPTKSTRTTTKLKRRANVIPGRKSRSELMGVREVEVVQKTNGKMVAMALRNLKNAFKEAREENEKLENKTILGVRHYEK